VGFVFAVEVRVASKSATETRFGDVGVSADGDYESLAAAITIERSAEWRETDKTSTNEPTGKPLVFENNHCHLTGFDCNGVTLRIARMTHGRTACIGCTLVKQTCGPQKSIQLDQAN
jgi:hypothetical protein